MAAHSGLPSVLLAAGQATGNPSRDGAGAPRTVWWPSTTPSLSPRCLPLPGCSIPEAMKVMSTPADGNPSKALARVIYLLLTQQSLLEVVEYETQCLHVVVALSIFDGRHVCEVLGIRVWAPIDFGDCSMQAEAESDTDSDFSIVAGESSAARKEIKPKQKHVKPNIGRDVKPNVGRTAYKHSVKRDALGDDWANEVDQRERNPGQQSSPLLRADRDHLPLLPQAPHSPLHASFGRKVQIFEN